MLAALVCLLHGGHTQASPASADYLIDIKDTEDNLPSSIVTAIAQTPDGYLWVGTYNGLSRFDGERFVNFDSVTTPEISYARIQGLFLDVTGTLWINTYRGGLTSYRDGVFRQEWADDPAWYDLHTTLAFSSTDTVLFVTQFGDVLRRRTVRDHVTWKAFAPPAGTRPIFQCADADGRLWLLTREYKLLWFMDGRFEEPPENTGLSDRRITAVVADAQGRVWVGGQGAIARWTENRFQTVSPTEEDPDLDPAMLLPARDGSLWVLSNDRLRRLVERHWTTEVKAWDGLLGWASGRAMGAHEDRAGGIWFNHYGNGLFHIAPNGELQRFTSNDGLPGDRVGAWFEAEDGGIWLGVDRGGLVRLRERRIHVIGADEGLPARAALTVCQDTDGAMWIGTGGGGLCRWSEGEITRFSLGNSASSNFIFSVYPRAGGGLWMSAGEGEDLNSFRGNQLQKPPWEAHAVKSILTDSSGRVWAGTKASLTWWSEAGRHTFGTNDGMSLSAVRALTEGPDGKVWCGADDGTLYRCEPDQLEAFRVKDPLADQPIWSLLADKDGVVWVGTFRGGLLRFKEGRFSRFTARQGLPVDVISQIVDDGRGRLWLGTHQGICSISKSALNACADGQTNGLDCVTYGRLDGLPTLECSDGYQPACWRSADGRLWFTTVKGVVWIDPGKLEGRSVRPRVLIEEFRVDGERQDLRSAKVVVPPGHRQFEFTFTALSFEATRFRYRLEGLGTDWVESGTGRTAQYMHLPPREYRFCVIACDNRGLWSATGPVLAFTVRPYFYQTWWFVALISMLVLGGVALAVRTTAGRKYRMKLARLEQQHAIERDRARIAKDIHDDIGAGLTQITLLSELARREKDQAPEHLARISDSARQLTRAMDEIVWAVDPQHDTFTGLMDYISAYAEDFLRVAGIRCRMDLPTALPPIRVDAELRYHLFLALKETLNNIVKHAQATEVWLRLRTDANGFGLVVEDNGKGLPANGAEVGLPGKDRISSGFGLANIEKRLAQVGGRLVIESHRGQGTRVEMIIIAAPASPVVAIG